ncbi:poly(U)-specific endoribonuclease-like [Stylophora pistillata]|uniref:poly(U)-specific endoribonuclease-like n=1 Tax=Stylophora pistillata TaxID=50429 RepID=UPI000C03B1B8|nr:poly(U)-specific endoribonuclease-like [Stylophora pistillata]
MKIFVFILVTSSCVESSQAAPTHLKDDVCQKMWDNAENNLLLPGELAVNTGNYPNALFMLVKGGGSRGEKKLQSPVFTTFHDLLVDYQAAPYNFEQQHVKNFISAVTQPSGPVEAAFNYLKTQKKALPYGVNTLTKFGEVLKKMWFLYSHGFKHVFVGNERTYDFNGFHNWYQFYTEEPNFLRGFSFTWRGLQKGAPSSMFVGTSPAFDLALFTTCFLQGRGDGGGGYPYDRATTNCMCEINVPGIGKSKVKVTTVENKFGEVVSAYPTDVY